MGVASDLEGGWSTLASTVLPGTMDWIDPRADETALLAMAAASLGVPVMDAASLTTLTGTALPVKILEISLRDNI